MVQFNELSKSRLLVLELFLGNPTGEISYTGVREKTKLAKATLSESLKFLIGSEFLEARRIGVTKLYKLKRESQIIKQFKILHSIMRLSVLKGVEERHGCEIFLYGSAARGEDTEKSDIDLLIIGDVGKEWVREEITKRLRKLGKEVKIQFFTSLEWAGMAKKDKAFYERVEKDKIKIE